jgi:hypothetical protein
MKKKNIYWIVTMFVFVTLMAVSCNLEEDNPFIGTWK